MSGSTAPHTTIGSPSRASASSPSPRFFSGERVGVRGETCAHELCPSPGPLSARGARKRREGADGSERHRLLDRGGGVGRNHLAAHEVLPVLELRLTARFHY